MVSARSPALVATVALLTTAGCAPLGSLVIIGPVPKGATPQPGRMAFIGETRSPPDRRVAVDGGDVRWCVDFVDVAGGESMRFETAAGYAADGGLYVVDRIEGGPRRRWRDGSVGPTIGVGWGGHRALSLQATAGARVNLSLLELEVDGGLRIPREDARGASSPYTWRAAARVRLPARLLLSARLVREDTHDYALFGLGLERFFDGH